MNLPWKTLRLERPYFYGQWGGLLRQVSLDMKINLGKTCLTNFHGNMGVPNSQVSPSIQLNPGIHSAVLEYQSSPSSVQDFVNVKNLIKSHQLSQLLPCCTLNATHARKYFLISRHKDNHIKHTHQTKYAAKFNSKPLSLLRHY